MRTVLEPALMTTFSHITKLIYCFPIEDEAWACKVELTNGTTRILEVHLDKKMTINRDNGVVQTSYFAVPQTLQGALF